MWRFAWRNLLTRPLRTMLGLVGLAMPIVGFIGLFSISYGMRNLVGSTLDQIQGLMVQRANVLSPVFSDLPADFAEIIRQLPGIRGVAPEVWGLAPEVEGESTFGRAIAAAVGSGLLNRDGSNSGISRRSPFDAPVISGQDIAAHLALKTAVYPKNMLPPDQGGGRFLAPSDAGTNRIVISKKIATDYPRPDQTPRQVGDTLRIGRESFEIVGIYECKSPLLDVVIIMDIDTARRALTKSKDMVSSIYVEGNDPAGNAALAAAIEAAAAERGISVEARSMNDFLGIFATLMADFDLFLLGIVGLALAVGVVGIVNTMLMSTTERFSEFGVLRTNGWSRGDVMLLVTAESGYLGLLAGVFGATLAVLGIVVVNQFIDNGLQLSIPPILVALSVVVAVVVAILGGLYPAAKAAWMAPMEAIRLGGAR